MLSRTRKSVSRKFHSFFVARLIITASSRNSWSGLRPCRRADRILAENTRFRRLSGRNEVEITLSIRCTTNLGCFRRRRQAGRRGSQTPLFPDFSINRSALDHPRNVQGGTLWSHVSTIDLFPARANERGKRERSSWKTTFVRTLPEILYKQTREDHLGGLFS